MKAGTNGCQHYRESILRGVCEGEDSETTQDLETHLADCPECRRYAGELRATVRGLRSLAPDNIQPSAGFRARWRREVRKATQPTGTTEWAWQLLENARSLLRRNRRPLLALAPVWILVLFFRAATPETASQVPTKAARSPVEIVNALKAQEPVLGVLSASRNPWLALPPRLTAPPHGGNSPGESPDSRGDHSANPDSAPKAVLHTALQDAGATTGNHLNSARLWTAPLDA